ncbi:MAG: hypothetical protein GYA62_04750 [Bacteroidales bacterium]|nr:hypothetical protein [Bacteroidales bacterium]
MKNINIISIIIIILIFSKVNSLENNTTSDESFFQDFDDGFQLFDTIPTVIKDCNIDGIDEYIYYKPEINTVINRSQELKKMPHNEFMGPVSPKNAIYETFGNITNYLNEKYIAMDCIKYYKPIQNNNPCKSKVIIRYKFENIKLQSVFSNSYIIFSMYSDKSIFNESNIKNTYEKYFVISNKIPFESLIMKYKDDNSALYITNKNKMLFDSIIFLYYDHHRLIICFPNGLSTQKSNRSINDPWF